MNCGRRGNVNDRHETTKNFTAKRLLCAEPGPPHLTGRYHGTDKLDRPLTFGSSKMATPENHIADSLSQSPVAPAAATARYARKKRAIVAAASEILNRDGVKGMTLASVAAQVGLITTSVTYYFKKKEDLAVACFLDGIERIDAIMDEALKAATPQQRLLRLIQLWLDLRSRIAAGEDPAISVFNDIRALQKPLRTVVLTEYMKFFAKLRSVFDDADFGWLDEQAKTARAHVMTEHLFWSVAWLPRYDLDDYPRIRDRMFDILMNGLGVTQSRWNPAVLPLDSIVNPSGAEVSAAETFFIAATRLINERGYRGASVEKISERLNVTKGSFYHHNDAKDDLVVECFERSFETMRRIQRAVALRAENHWSNLATVATALVNYQLSERGPLLRTSALTALPLAMRSKMVESSNRVSDRFAASISDGIAELSVRPVDPFIAAQMLTATMNAAAEIRWWIPDVLPENAATLYAKPMLMGIFSR